MNDEMNYDVENGMSGMQRDIIVELCNMMWRKPHLIRMIVGMCREHLEWKKHWFFLHKKIYENLTLAFLPNSALGENVAIVGNEIKKSDSESYNFILDTVLDHGLFKIVLNYECDVTFTSCFCCGLVHKSSISHRFHSRPSGKSGYCVVFFNGIECGDKSVHFARLYEPTENHTLALELNTEKTGKGGIMHIYVDDKQIPCAITEIPSSVHFYFNMEFENRAEVVSFQQLSTPTTNHSLRCSEYKWR